MKYNKLLLNHGKDLKKLIRLYWVPTMIKEYDQSIQ